MIIALFPNEQKQESFELGRHIQKFLKAQGVHVVAEQAHAARLETPPLSSVEASEIQFLLSIGGDGTILRLIHRYSHLPAAILGINLGNLGFMADVPASDVYPSLKDLLNGSYTIESRMVLEALRPQGDPLYAVNDLVAHRGKNDHLVRFSIRVDGKFFNTFAADGIIIATPNGSTAYSLAAGGPILSPTLDAIVITPICPHTISNRPIVLSPHGVLELEYSSPYQPIEIRADGLHAFPLSFQETVRIQKSHRTFKWVNLHRHEYFATLRTKLGWSGTSFSRPSS